MIDRILADMVVVVHLAFIVFVAVGGLMAWRWPKVLWLHVPAVVWAAGIVTVGYPCPLTSLEDDLRSRGGDRVYPGGFIAHYLDNVLYPERFKALARLLVALLVVLGWVGGGDPLGASLAWYPLAKDQAAPSAHGRTGSLITAVGRPASPARRIDQGHFLATASAVR